jgi:transposase
LGKGNITRHGFFKLKHGSRRRRYRCTACGKTFASTQGTPYRRLHCTRRDFDEVAVMSVEGVSRSAIARIKRVPWNTVARWLERAAVAAGRFNDRMSRGYELREIQADEIKTFLINKENTTWVMTTIEVWSRLWPSTIVGPRSYRNVRRLMADTSRRGRFEGIPLITTDGFYYYSPAIRRLCGRACVYLPASVRNGTAGKPSLL